MEIENMIEYIRNLASALNKAERSGEEGAKYITISDVMVNRIYEDLLMISNKLDNYKKSAPTD